MRWQVLLTREVFGRWLYRKLLSYDWSGLQIQVFDSLWQESQTADMGHCWSRAVSNDHECLLQGSRRHYSLLWSLQEANIQQLGCLVERSWKARQDRRRDCRHWEQERLGGGLENGARSDKEWNLRIHKADWNTDLPLQCEVRRKCRVHFLKVNGDADWQDQAKCILELGHQLHKTRRWIADSVWKEKRERKLRMLRILSTCMTRNI